MFKMELTEKSPLKKNIVFFLIDGLRADQCHGENKSSKTPNIDLLIKNGIYCKHAISSADGTIISLNTTFSSKFQFGNAVRYQKLVLDKNNFLEILKKHGYHMYGAIPNMTSFKPLGEYFENENNGYEFSSPLETLSTGLTERIIQILESKELLEPYFCYFHLFDLHPLREGKKSIGIEKFENEEFGSSTYARTVSLIDYWLGKILAKIDTEKTLVVITGDHGERIPYEDKGYSDFQPRFDSATKLGRKHIPKSAHNLGGKFFGKAKNTVGKIKLSYSNTKLTPYEKRSRDPYFTLSLFDELIHVPLIFSGIKLPGMIISQQVSSTDIFPTICDIVGLPPINPKIHGSSLVPLISKNLQKEHPIYLHTMPYEEPSSLDRVGLRTSKYKYFRKSQDSKKNVNLYDLKKDPYENRNIAKDHPLLVEEMEKILSELISSSKELELEEISKVEEEKIAKELKKLGYM